MYSLTFCVRLLLPERHQWKPAVQAAAVMLRTPPSTASHRPAARAHTAERSHYVVISRDKRKLVTRARVILTQQRNPCTDCKSAQQCTTRGNLYHAPKLHPGPCSSVGVRPQTDTQTDTQTRVTTIHYASSTTHAKCNNFLLVIYCNYVAVCHRFRNITTFTVSTSLAAVTLRSDSVSTPH